MKPQSLTLSTDRAIRRERNPIRTVPTLQKQGRSTNLRIVASSSIILCSMALLNTGLQATESEPSPQPCDPASASSDSDQCSQNGQQRENVAPEVIPAQQWSDRVVEHLPFNTHSDQLPKEVETTYAELLNRAQAAASRDQLTTAVEVVAGIPKNSQHYEVAQQLEEDWSKELVQQATNRFQQADVKTSIALLDKIPETSQWHDRGTELKQQWKQQAQLLSQAKSAKTAQDWQKTINAIKALEGTPLYNSLPVQELLQQAMINRYEPDPVLLQIAIEDIPMMSKVAAQ